MKFSGWISNQGTHGCAPATSFKWGRRNPTPARVGTPSPAAVRRMRSGRAQLTAREAFAVTDGHIDPRARIVIELRRGGARMYPPGGAVVEAGFGDTVALLGLVRRGGGNGMADVLRREAGLDLRLGQGRRLGESERDAGGGAGDNEGGCEQSTSVHCAYSLKFGAARGAVVEQAQLQAFADKLSIGNL